MAKSINKDQKLDNQLCFSLYSASLAMGKMYKPLLEKLGITYPQYLLMLVLWEGDQITATELSQRLGQDKGALTPVIKRLENLKLISRHRDPGDERRVFIELTTSGKSMQKEAESIPEKVLLACGLTRQSAKVLREQIEVLRQSLKP
ncbi:MarR family winged helix-turn-helix transcriptional regulator [Microbulbifer variabilis]|uniref:MarR family winged helix-turn-helix transcriptional regulator n=1 Tax=Microbulbifer variabilis TaxID=266805 RepID=UPI000373FEF3|nr:MarR family transcriptional regulator [Microbulbifer variabilis]